MKKNTTVQNISLAITAIMILSCFAGCSQTGENNMSANTEIASITTPLPKANTVTVSENVITTALPEAIPLILTADIGKSDLKDDWDSSATEITLNTSSISVNGSGATATNSTLTITSAGTYVISGKLTDGQIFVNATNEDKVYLILNGVDITNKTGAAIYAAQCDKLIVTLAEGTQNTLTDGGANYKYADIANEEPNAALFSKDDLTINGTGTLVVNADFNNGIGTKDDLLIVSGNLSINAVNHGLRGNDSITVLDGDIQITAGNDGIQTNNTEDADKGWILVEGGKFTISAAHDGVQVDTTLSIAKGEFSITTGNNTSTDTTSESYKALKAGTDISITDGSFTINSTDDGIHANGNITVNGGSFIISTGDDGIHADGNLTINHGDIEVTKAYEGLEAANIIITGGTVNLVTSDDALNAAGGNDGSGNGGRFGKEQFAAGGAYSIDISGGTITSVAGGDGIDSNGSLNISGGTIISLISSSRDNGAIDCDGSITFTGGTVIYGGSGTGSRLSESSTQSYVSLDKGINAGSEVSVQHDGKILASFTPTIDCQYLTVSTPDVVIGNSYAIYSDGVFLATPDAGTGGESVIGGRGMFGERDGSMKGQKQPRQ